MVGSEVKMLMNTLLLAMSMLGASQVVTTEDGTRVVLRDVGAVVAPGNITMQLLP
jgi:hypothetical protein